MSASTNLNFERLSKSPRVFSRVTGLSLDQFKEVSAHFSVAWEQHIQKTQKGVGRPFSLSIEDMILMTLLYYRTYMGQEWLGYLFGLHNSNVSRLIRRVESVLAPILQFDRTKSLKEETLNQLKEEAELEAKENQNKNKTKTDPLEIEDEQRLIDATEQRIQRPKTKDQKPYYSGKKKCHTLKTEIHIRPNGKIIHVSDSSPGSVHDFTVHKNNQIYDSNERLYVDSGYQGLQNLHTQTELPFKGSKNKPLDEESKLYNRALSGIRVTVEHIIGDMKVFKILDNVYRNARETYNKKFCIIAGLTNVRNGFGIG